jgi:fumarylpyruvate hydrolase
VNRIYCVGRNYREHALEMGANPDREPPFFFQKPANAIVDTYSSSTSRGGAQIPFPPMTMNLHYEGELVVAIGGKMGIINMSNPQEAIECVYGYAVGCDLTRRDLQEQAKKQSRPWDTAKGFDGSAPCGPIVPKNDIRLEHSTLLQLQVGNAMKQQGTLGQMIWSIPETLVHLSRYFKLMPGDLVMTGTPAGVGSLQVGDSVKISCGDLPPCEFSICQANLRS